MNTGGPAFPTTAMTTDNGMTLRDYFAAKASEEDIADAMNKVLKIEKIVNGIDGKRAIVFGLPDEARQLARYICADAMLKAREQ